MKNYWVAFGLIVSIGLAGFGLIIFKCFIQESVPQLFYLNIDSMREAGRDLTDTTDKPAVSCVYPANKENVADAIPWADLYVCRSYEKSDSLSGDTVMVLIDVNTKIELKDLKDVNHYSANINPGKKYKKIRVLIPSNQTELIKRCRYKFGKVKLEDDFLYD
jgi:hypothetical protein